MELTLIVAIIGALVCVPPALQSLGVDVQIFGRKKMDGDAKAVQRDWKWGIVLFVAFLSLILSSIGLYRSIHRDLLHWTMKPDEEELVYGKHYHNEVVDLDGKKFDHCSFENVTLFFHGTAPTDFVACSFPVSAGESTILKSDNDAAKGFEKLLAFLKGIPNAEQFSVEEMDSSGNVKILTKETKQPPCTGQDNKDKVPTQP